MSSPHLRFLIWVAITLAVLIGTLSFYAIYSCFGGPDSGDRAICGSVGLFFPGVIIGPLISDIPVVTSFLGNTADTTWGDILLIAFGNTLFYFSLFLLLIHYRHRPYILGTIIFLALLSVIAGHLLAALIFSGGFAGGI